MGPIQSFSELISALRRRVATWSSIIIVGVFITLLYTYSLPRLYESTAVIQIMNSKISSKITGNTAGAPLKQQFQQLEQRIMARDNLIAVINKNNLFNNDVSLTVADKVNLLRIATEITQIIDPSQAWSPTATPSALTVSVRLGDPELVTRVTQDFVDDILFQNTQSRLKKAQQTLAFFVSEETRVGDAITLLDAEIALFKEANSTSLPTVIPAQLTLLVNLEKAALEIGTQIAALKSGKAKSRITGFDQQLLLLESQAKNLADRMTEVKQGIAAAPKIEKEFNGLTRKLKQLETQFTTINQNRSNAEIEQMLETGRQSNSLSVLEKPIAPDWPVSPNRKKIAVAGGMLSLVLAAAVCFLLEILNPVIRNASQLERQLQITPVVTIPVIKSVKTHIRPRLLLTTGLLSFTVSIWTFLKMTGKSIG